MTVIGGYTILRLIPESLLQLVIGGLLLTFGLQWLRKAVLRSAGLKAMHDEAAIFAEEAAAARAAGNQQAFGLDWFAFVVSFKGVLLEGLEVVVIVLTFGISAGNIPLAAAGALLAILPVTALVIVIRGPLARVPENAIKMTVGLLLTTFGSFWAIEGLGWFAADQESLAWPLGRRRAPDHPRDLDRRRPVAGRAAAAARRARAERRMTFLRAFGRFWYEFLVGDDWRIVAGVTAILGLGALAVAMGLTGPALPIALFLGLVALFAVPLLTDRQI